MAVLELFSSPIRSRYNASICTKATIFAIIAFLFTVIPPFLIAYRSEGFWIKQAYYREQPDVKFKHQILLVLHTDSQIGYVTWSTYLNFNLLEQANIRIPLIKSREEDSNRDGKNDKFHFSIEVPVLDTEKVLGAQVIFIFDYRLYRFSDLRMETMAYVSHTSAMAGAELSVDGDLRLRLKQPLAHKGLDTRYNVPIIDSTSVFAEDYSFSKIFSSYQQRNISTRFECDYPVWLTGRGSGQPFIIRGTIYYPEETIVYPFDTLMSESSNIYGNKEGSDGIHVIELMTGQHLYSIPFYFLLRVRRAFTLSKGFWQVIKFGWIQYLSVLFLFIFLMERVRTFVFENQIVNTIVHHPVPETYKNHFT